LFITALRQTIRLKPVSFSFLPLRELVSCARSRS
jgi:hypothetical protein